jgi:hypothetical protein
VSLKRSLKNFIIRDAKIKSTSSGKVFIFLCILHQRQFVLALLPAIETAIGNLGDEIRQDKDPYTNIALCRVLHVQLNSICAMLPHIKLKKDDGLPLGAKDLGNGYALLRACEDTAKPVTKREAHVIMDYWANKEWPNQGSWPRAVKRWAQLHLPNGQIA